MTNRVFKFFSSLRLTVVLLGLALILVFIGTLAQVKLGLYDAQSAYFRSLFVFWQPNGANWKIPVFPGGWLLGGLLLVNLVAAHIKRFSISEKKIGIFIIHGGLILLLLGQFCTELFQVESNIRFEEGETRNYSEDSRHNELAIIDVSNPDHDQVYSISETLLAKGGVIRDAKLPFTVRVKKYFPNSDPAGPMNKTQGEKINASSDDGSPLWFSEVPITASMERKNVPAALVEFISAKGDASEKVASLWVDNPQTIELAGHSYKFALRPIRYYKPYNITLLDFSHDLYQGTGVAKNFSSKIHLGDPSHGEDREVVIRMNEPLRYRGETFFQSGFDERNDKVTILQVVRNPAAITPYLACTLVGAGLLTQFLMHLVSFGKKSRDKKQTEPAHKNSLKTKPVAAATSGGKTL